MRVLLVTPDFPPAPGGIQVVMHRIAAHTHSLKIRVVTRDGQGAGEFDRAGGLDVVRAGGGGRAGIAALNLRALAEAARFRPRVVLSGHIVAGPAGATLGLAGIPFVEYVHADEVRHRERLARLVLGRATATVAVSEHSRQIAVAAGADPARVRCVPNGVDWPAEVRREPADRPTLVTVGRLVRRYKGHDVMLRALPLVRERVPDVRWLVVGDGVLRPELERRAAEQGLDGAVSFLGALDDAARDAALAESHVFVMPSRLPAEGTGGEGFGIAYLEASAHGLPVIAGNVGGALDAVVHDQTGLLVEPTDPAAVADAICALLLDPGRAEALGRAGRERAREFDWPVIVDRLERLLHEVARA